ncbi:RHS repeat-associated core domain-containing protein [Acidovorax sp. NCPPB 2350]|nr:RHS repeat-associated core domain-containing protein [Acidovorax sp. NCPPB 2350]
MRFDLRYPGQVWDEETGLSYNLHRYYDAGTGGYIQADPIGLEGGWNRFLYVEADPLASFDPDALVKKPGKIFELMPLEGNGGGLGAGGGRPLNYSPSGSGRSSAFNEAKRLNGIPTSQQPSAVQKSCDRRGDLQPGR